MNHREGSMKHKSIVQLCTVAYLQGGGLYWVTMNGGAVSSEAATESGIFSSEIP